jgi:hypothetical protein
MKPLHEVNPLVMGQEESAGDDDGLSSEERTQLRELCVLIMISEFLERNNETE